MAQSILNHPQAILSELRRDYDSSDEKDILTFLEDHPTVAPLLLDSRAYYGTLSRGARLSRSIRNPAAMRTCRFRTNYGKRVESSDRSCNAFMFGASTQTTTRYRFLMLPDRQPSLRS